MSALLSGSADAELLRADRLRDGDAEGVNGALGIYAAHAAGIDPRTPDGAGRALWLLKLGRALDPAFEDLVERTARQAEAPDTRELAEVVRFQFPFQRGDLAAAESHLRGLLRRLRGTGSLREIGVVNNLALVYQTGWREFEVLVLARRAQRLAASQDHLHGVAIGHARAAWAFERLGEWDDLAAQADALERLLPEFEVWHHAPALRVIHGARRALCLARGDHDGARRHHGLACASDADRWRSGDDAHLGALLEARIALAEGRPADAAAAIGPAAAFAPAGSANAVTAAALLVRALAAAGDAARAAAEAGPLLRVLRAPPSAKAGVSVLLDAATVIGDALADRAAAPFFEAASALLMRRIAELHECFTHIEELSDAADEDRAILARHRVRFVADQRRALEAISALLEDPAAPRPPELERLAEDGRLRICSWCLTMRTADGLALPVGHLVPGAVRLAVTHGICDPCLAALPR